jgi:hypothetical protein
MLTIACVLKSGPEYRVEHVVALAAGVQRYLSLPHRIVCLTDCGAVAAQIMIRCGIEPIPLKHGWPGWFSKIELFRPGLFDGPVWYSDLDAVICGSLDDLVLGHRFTVLRNFWSDARIGSGLMAWDTDLSRIYRRFQLAPAQAIREFVTTEKWGDQGFIRAHTPIKPELWQVKHPGRVVSYKKHVLPNGGRIPEGASVCCYHGKPRPWDTSLWQREQTQMAV